jgi:hypothetical protein
MAFLRPARVIAFSLRFHPRIPCILQEALKESEVWVAYNVSSSQIDEYSAVAAECGVQRVVFGVCMESEQRGADVLLESATAKLAEAGIQYTFIKYAEVAPGREALQPYRIVRDVLALPCPASASPLSADDLFRVSTKCTHHPSSIPHPPLPTDCLLLFLRLTVSPVLVSCKVLSETVDLPKTYNSVYGIGPGTSIDSEILVFMKSSGWPERVQIGMLMGDIMERIEVKVEEENKRAAAAALAEKENPTVKPISNEFKNMRAPANKMAGFFQ